MQKIYVSDVPLWQFDLLSKEDKVRHYVSGREGGASEGPLGSFNLSFSVNDDPEKVKANRKLLAESMGITPEKLFFPRQTHSDHVKLVDDTTKVEDLTETDALITKTKGISISVMSADCVPVLLYDPVQHAAAAIHAGWRGTVAKIVSKTVEAMQEHFDTYPSDLIVGIGPSICQEVYEVGEEVIVAVEEAFGRKKSIIRTAEKPGKAYVNLWEANRIQLIELGVEPAHIEISGLCTYKLADQFFSARKSENKAGRFAAGILLL